MVLVFFVLAALVNAGGQCKAGEGEVVVNNYVTHNNYYGTKGKGGALPQASVQIATPYSLTLTTAPGKSVPLGYNLHIFKGAKKTAAEPLTNFVPAVWGFVEGDLVPSVLKISWQEIYQIFSSVTIIKAQTQQIGGHNPFPATLGQGLTITKRNGQGTFMTTTPSCKLAGADKCFYFQNQGGSGFTGSVGVSQLSNKGGLQPLGAVNILPGGSVTMVPVETVAIIYYTGVRRSGSLIHQAFAGGVVMDFTKQNDHKLGWDGVQFTGCTDSSWCRAFNAGQNMNEVMNTLFQ